MPTKYMDSVVPLESEADVVRLVQRMAVDQTRMAKDLVRIGNDSLLHGRYITDLCNKAQTSWAGAATASSNNNNNLAFMFPFLAGIKPPNSPPPTPAPAPTLTSPHVDPNRTPQISASGTSAEFLPGISATDHQMQVRTPTVIPSGLAPTDTYSGIAAQTITNSGIAAQTITIAFATPYDYPPNVQVQVIGSQSVLLDLVTERQLVLSFPNPASRAATTTMIMISVHPVARDRWYPGP